MLIFFVGFIPIGMFSKGHAEDDFIKLSGLPRSKHQESIAKWLLFEKILADLSKSVGAGTFAFDKNIFSDMGIAEYAVLPDDFHYSLESHRRVGIALGEIFSGRVRQLLVRNGHSF